MERNCEYWHKVVLFNINLWWIYLHYFDGWDVSYAPKPKHFCMQQQAEFCKVDQGTFYCFFRFPFEKSHFYFCTFCPRMTNSCCFDYNCHQASPEGFYFGRFSTNATKDYGYFLTLFSIRECSWFLVFSSVSVHFFENCGSHVKPIWHEPNYCNDWPSAGNRGNSQISVPPSIE